MGENQFEIEKFYDVVNNDDGSTIRVGPDDDGLGMIQISPPNAKSRDTFGNFRLVLEPDQAQKLARALNEAIFDNLHAREDER
jgi:hypothetical protein